jgi:apolipoprotein N-acyltransferase
MFTFAKKHRYAWSILSGILLVISFPFTGSLVPLVLIALVPLLLVESHVANRNLRSGKVFVHAYITFFIYNVGTTWWIWNASPGGALMAFFLNAFLMALVFYFFHLTKKIVGKKEGYLAFFFYWIAFEYIHYHWELSWPWLNFGNAFAKNPYLVQWYSYSGVLGGTLWILISNIFVFRLIQNVYVKKEAWRIQRPWVYGIAAVIIIPISISLIQFYSYEEYGKDTEIVVTQPNVDPYNEKFTGSINDQLNDICDLADSKVTEKTDFVLAPETALPFLFYEDEIKRIIYYHYLVERKAKWHDASLFIGASTKKYFKHENSRASKQIEGGPGFEEYYNSSMLINEFDDVSFVHKSKLVLGVEKVPFSNIFPFLEELSIDNGGTSGTLGIEDESQVMMSKGITFAPVVCYESIYGEFISQQCRKGAEIIFIITNDGWWGDTPGYKQHLALARLRAVETRKSIARSANTGTSCFINQRGEVLQQTEWWKKAAIRETLKRNNTVTFYVKYGDIIGRTFGFVAAIMLLLTFVKRIKKKAIESEKK